MKTSIKIIITVFLFIRPFHSKSQEELKFRAPRFTSSALHSIKNDSIKHNAQMPYFIPSIVSPDLYTRDFGFFCKKELQVEKLTNVKVRFRLGSMQQSDFLEGKTKYNPGLR
jgi:hypothetical protein